VEIVTKTAEKVDMKQQSVIFLWIKNGYIVLKGAIGKTEICGLCG